MYEARQQTTTRTCHLTTSLAFGRTGQEKVARATVLCLWTGVFIERFASDGSTQRHDEEVLGAMGRYLWRCEAKEESDRQSEEGGSQKVGKEKGQEEGVIAGRR